MVWLILGGSLFIVAMFWAMCNDGSELFIWVLCIVGMIAILIHFFKIPTAMDLHAGKAVIKYEVVDGVKVDSTFVFKNK